MSKVIIGQICSPSTVIKKETKKVTEFLVSYGGGMGGSSERFYGEIVKDDGKEIEVKTFQGRLITINKTFIVYKREKQLFTLTVDAASHANYHKHTVNECMRTRTTVHEIEDVIEFDSNKITLNSDFKTIHSETINS